MIRKLRKKAKTQRKRENPTEEKTLFFLLKKSSKSLIDKRI